MKTKSKLKNHCLLAAAVAAASFMPLSPANAQIGGPGSGPQNFNGATAKLFGDNTSFTATVELQVKAPEEATIPGKLSMTDGKTRFAIEMSKLKSARMPAEAAAQMKAMGMNELIAIARPDTKTQYLLYPGLESYVSMPMKEGEAVGPEGFKMELTELGKETIDGHPCVKNKAVVTSLKGDEKHEATLWNATDLKKFPVKIQQAEQGTEVVMLFKDVKLAKPATSEFDAPAAFTKYDSMPAMIQSVMTKKLGANPGAQVQPVAPGAQKPKQQ